MPISLVNTRQHWWCETMVVNSEARNLPAKQRGAVILLSVVLLLVLVIAVTVITGRIKSFEHKILLNSQSYQQAFATAEAGLNEGLGRLTADPDWDGTAMNGVLVGFGNYSIAGVMQQVLRDSTVVELFNLQATGTSLDGLATVTLREQALQYSVLANPPDVPLIVAGGLGVSGNFEVVANPNGGGEGVPLSIWTDQAVDLNTGSGTTCGLQEFSDGQCSSNPYSENGFKDSDILDSDPNFPTDMLEYLFNVPSANWENLKADANETATDCNSLGPASEGLIWIDGDCSINAGTIVGGQNAPVILIVTDGDLTMNGGAEIWGIVFSFRKPGSVLDFEINMIGGARVNGVVASNHPVGHSGGTYNSVYDTDVLEALEQNSAFRRIARVPGSWRDF